MKINIVIDDTNSDLGTACARTLNANGTVLILELLHTYEHLV